MVEDKFRLTNTIGIDPYAALQAVGVSINEILYSSDDNVGLKVSNWLYSLERHFTTYHSQGGKLLDIFCGDGKFCAQMQKEAPQWEVYGVEGNPAAMEIAKKNFLEERLTLQVCPPLPYDNNSFQIVHSNGIMDYSDSQKSLLNSFPQTFKWEELASEIQRVLLPGGLYLTQESYFFSSKEQAVLVNAGFNPIKVNELITVFQKK
ncbi:class I SAM-dependent methyltransferase [Candidatus Woesearchaeota archaeon]|nr:class I SAM-dependent methyltransferase [Candidatus Woesearchaeota archaeon]